MPLMPDSANAAILGRRVGPLAMIPGGSPVPPDPEPVWQPFTVTVADTGDWIGYTSGDIASPPFNPPVGTISGQPNSRHALEALYVDMGDGAVVVIFRGDMTGAAQGLGVQIDDYQGEASDVSMFAGNTVIRFAPPRNPLNDGETYGVVFTPMEA